jgi:hypothetical protein
MSRRPEPDRVLEARRHAIRNRLMGIEGLFPKQADEWLARWTEHKGEPQTSDDFEAAYRWIVGELNRKQRQRDG